MIYRFCHRDHKGKHHLCVDVLDSRDESDMFRWNYLDVRLGNRYVLDAQKRKGLKEKQKQ